MKSTEYLYGVSPKDMPMPNEVKEWLLARNKRAKELRQELLGVPITDRDFHRIKAITDAISFNERLLEQEI